MGRRRVWQGLGIGFIGLALSLAPMSLASAHSTKNSKHHATAGSQGTNGSNPGSPICVDIKSAQKSEGSAFGNALKNGTSFASIKAALLSSFKFENNAFQKAASAIGSAPPNVQKAFKGILVYVGKLKSAIAGATSLQGLTTAEEAVGSATQLEAEGTTIDNWARSICGSSVVPTTTSVSVPSGLGSSGSTGTTGGTP